MAAKAGVAAGHEQTAQTAVEILRAGGNAYDAAVAAIAMACVCEPVLASPGGGGFLTALPVSGPPLVYDFFVQTPQCRNRDGENFYPIEVDFGDATQAFHIGPGASATPGLIKGLMTVSRELGRMPIKEVLAPAAALAREGVEINAFQAFLFEVVAPIYTDTAQARDQFCKDPNAKLLVGEGDTLHFPMLADLLETLAIEGEDLFYRGEVAHAMLHQCRDHGGHLIERDLLDYEVERRPPCELGYRGHQLFINPPPSSGGVLIGFALQLLAALPVSRHGRLQHLRSLAEVMGLTSKARLDSAQRSPDDPLMRLLDPDFVQRYRVECAQRSTALRGTTHVSVIDQLGNHAALTVSNGEGNGHMVPGAGFMLNNMLGEDDLNPNGFGLWRENERMTSMMAPAVLHAKGANHSWVLGSGGSNRIRSAILQVINNLLDHSFDVNAAVNAPRIHLEDQLLNIEAGFDPEVVAALREQFPEHHCWEGKSMFFGGVHTVERRPDGSVLGAADPRRGGCYLPQ
ncbi:MAG: gamma-glutamyltransferase [Pseudomonadota bacterium]